MFNFSNLINIDFSWLIKSLYGTNNNDVMSSSFPSIYTEKYYGYGGNDTFMSSSGKDTYYGGTGIDTVNYSNSNAAVDVRLYTGRGSGGDAQGDRYSQIENIRGSDHNDRLFGNGADNKFNGGLGDDRIYGREGNDTFKDVQGDNLFDGGRGIDTVDYSQATGRVQINLDSQSAFRSGTGSGFDQDELVNIETVIGTRYDDTFRGDSSNNTFAGGSGDDIFYLDSGSDTYNGGSGFDEVRFSGDDMNINLVTGQGSGGVAEGDAYTSIESVHVRSGEDISIQGSQADEEFYFDMSDTENVSLNAGGGNDVVMMGTYESSRFDPHDNSSLDGGEGIDTFRADDTIGYADVVIDLQNDRYYAQGNRNDDVQISNFENAVGGYGNDLLIDAEDANNTLTGNYGEDTFVFDHDGNGTTETDIITDFSSGEDRIDLDDTEIDNWRDLLGESDGDFMIDMNGGVSIRTAENDNGQYDTIFLENVTVSELSESDFIF